MYAIRSYYAVGTTLGPYTMLPLALVHEHGFARAEANQLLALSRISGVFMASYNFV